MNILETLLNAQGGGAVQQMGQQLGLTPAQTTTALSALLPALATGFQRNIQSPGGTESLASALETGHHQRYLENPAMLNDPTSMADGNGILSHIFGGKEVSRQVASRAAQQTGIGEGVLKQMLPMAAALLMGSMARQSNQVPSAAAAGGPGSMDFMSMLTPLLDQNRDGSLMDDVTGMVGRFFGGNR
jgi:hypothetical protein